VLLRCFDNGVAVDDAGAEIIWRLQKLVADPQQIFGLLFGKRYARPDPGVNEQIAAFRVREFQAAQKADVGGRELVSQRAACSFKIGRAWGEAGRRLHAVARERRHAAIGAPMRSDLRMFEELQQEILVVAEEMDVLEAGPWRLQQQFDHATGVRPAVDIVTEIDDHLPTRGHVGGIGGDERV